MSEIRQSPPRPAGTDSTSLRIPVSSQAQLALHLRWLIAIRLIVVTSVVLPYFLAGTLSPGEQVIYDYLFRAAGAVYVISLAYLVMHAAGRPVPKKQAFLQYFGDLLLITGLVYFSGGTASPFSILYLIVITVASVLSRRRAGIIVATIAWLLYAGTVFALFFSWLEPPAAAEPTTPLRLAYHLAVHFFGFYAIAMLTSVLAKDVAAVERDLERKHQRLADLQVAHHDVLESIPSGLITTDLEGVISSANAAAREIFGRSEWQLIGANITETGFLNTATWQALRAGSDSAVNARQETDYDRGDRKLLVGFSLSPLTRADGTSAGYLVIFQDLSDWRKLQEQVRTKERMAAVGGMASGLAHEIGNPLAAISGSVQMLSSSLDGESAQRKLLDIILKESQRLDRTIKGFLKFARPQEAQQVRFDLQALLEENVELLRNSEEVSEHHEIELTLQPGGATLDADRDQISQLFWNLARNALRAMESGGLLRIVQEAEGDVCRMLFSDTGRGMTREERENIFHPFRSLFDGGSGIGMAIVYRIVQEHRGQIHVESEAGVGTTITVELPRADPGAPLLRQEG